jgi:hypothetical protein
MVFIMPVWLKRKTLSLIILSALIAGLSFVRLYAAEIIVNKVSSTIVNDIYVVNARLKYELGEKTTEALENGIPLTFYIEVEFEQPRKLIWNKEIVRHNHYMQLERHPLSDQYVLTNLSTSDQLSFNSLNDALIELGKISKLAITETKNIIIDTALIGRIRTGLDIESLPPPMRLQAWLSSEWRTSSGWHEWVINP